MDEKDRAMLKAVLTKRRATLELTKAEQKWADETLGKLFEKKFNKGVYFVNKTGDEIRKAGIPEATALTVDKSKVGSQNDAPTATERSAFGTKDAKIADDDTSGKVKEVEEGEMVDVDEKDGENAAEQVNAHDIINADNEDKQRKPVLKLGDVVIKEVNGRKYAGLVVKYYSEHGIAQVKWANGTFSNSPVSMLELLAKSVEDEKAKIEPPISDKGKKDAKTPPLDTAKEHQGLGVNKAFPNPKDKEKEFPPRDEVAAADSAIDDPDADKPAEDKPLFGEPAAEGVDEEAPAVEDDTVEITEEAPVDPAAPPAGDNGLSIKDTIKEGLAGAVKEAIKEAVTAAFSSDEVAAPAPVAEAPVAALPEEEEKDYHNTWTAKCMETVSKNTSVKNPAALCRLAYGKIGKSGKAIVKLDVEEVRKDNPGLAKYMDENGHKSLNIETKSEDVQS